jgi:hypothetical protein
MEEKILYRSVIILNGDSMTVVGLNVFNYIVKDTDQLLNQHICIIAKMVY